MPHKIPKNHPQIPKKDPKSTPNGSKIDPKSTQNRPLEPPGALLAAPGVERSIFYRYQMPKSSPKAPQRGPKSYKSSKRLPQQRGSGLQKVSKIKHLLPRGLQNQTFAPRAPQTPETDPKRPPKSKNTKKTKC